MSGAWRRIAAVGSVAAFAGACAASDDVATPAPNAGVYRVGQAYKIENVTYTPREQPLYDQTGVASWYGAEFHGRLTADGEVFDRNAISAAHPTLPMPVNVRVTNLDNGRSLMVRVNDRGPFIGGRVIDLSERAADMLGFKNAGTARVRVSYLGRADGKGEGVIAPPSERAGPVIAAAPRRVVAASILPLPGAKTAAKTSESNRPYIQTPASAGSSMRIASANALPAPAAVKSAVFVQAGAFGSIDNANRMRGELQGLGAAIAPATRAGRALYRVRIGPFDDVGEAHAALARVQSLGHNDARIVID